MGISTTEIIFYPKIFEIWKKILRFMVEKIHKGNFPKE